MFKLAIVLAYVAVIVILGYLSMRRTKTFGDFFLANRAVGPWLTAFTYGTAYFSAVLFIGFAGKVGWAFGAASLWIALGNTLIGTYLVWKLLGKKTMQVTQEMNVSTMPEFLEKRYDSQFLKAYSAVCIFVFFIPYSASVLMGLSYLFEINFNVPYVYAALGMGVLTAVYLVMGGYRAITVVDVFQGTVMIGGVVIMIAMFTGKAGGLTGILQTLRAIDPKLTSIWGPPGWLAVASLVILTSVAPFAMPQLIQRFYGIRDERSVRTGTIVATAFALIITFGAYYSGALTRVFISAKSYPQLFTNGKPIVDKLMPVMIRDIIPGTLSVVILLLVFAASMSTLAALVLVSSSSIVKDLFQGFIRRRAGEEELVLPMRVSCLVFIILSVVLALKRPLIILTMLSISWGAIASVFLAPFVYGLLWKRATRQAAIGSSVVGLGTVLVLYALSTTTKTVPLISSIGMLLSLALLPLFVVLQERLSRAGRGA